MEVVLGSSGPPLNGGPLLCVCVCVLALFVRMVGVQELAVGCGTIEF